MLHHASKTILREATGPARCMRLCTARSINARSPIVIAARFQSNEATSKPQFNTPNPNPSASLPPTSAAPSTASAPPPPPPVESRASLPPPPSPKKKRGFFGRLRLLLGWGTLGSIAWAGYFVYEANHPPEQLPFDPTKKTLAILGSGWGATALLDQIDTQEFNVVVISPVNYFLFTPLLPSVTVGTLNGRSITQPTRHLVRYKKREVQVLEAEATKVDIANKTITFEDRSNIAGNMGTAQVPYDYLVYAVGSENQTFGIEGVKKHALFLKELGDAESIRRRLMDCVEKASLLGQSEDEIDRLLHFVVVGGGPTGVEASGEFRDFVRDDLSKWYPAVSGRVRVTLIEALPAILPSFSKNLVEFTEHVFKESEIEILTKHMVQDADESSITVKNPNGEIIKIPTGMLIWAAGNTARPLTRDLQAQLKDVQTERRGLLVDECLRLKGAEESIFAIGDAAVTGAPPTAQTANQQGRYLASVLSNMARVDQLQSEIDELRKAPLSEERLGEIHRLERRQDRARASIKPFKFTNRGSMAYIGTEKAIVDLPYGGAHLSAGGLLTGIAWSSAYWSMLFGVRCRASVALDWLHVRVFGRSIESIRPSTAS